MTPISEPGWHKGVRYDLELEQHSPPQGRWTVAIRVRGLQPLVNREVSFSSSNEAIAAGRAAAEDLINRNPKLYSTG